MTDNTIAIVQARMGSSRLPNKSMLYLHGFPVIEWVLRRAGKADRIDKLIFAIPDSKENDSLNFYLEFLGANVFRGSEIDLVDRFYGAACEWKAKNIVRISADCPFVCGSEIDHLIEYFGSGAHDYVYNNIPLNNLYPDGLGAEIFSFEILKKVHEEAKDSYDREHVTTYIKSHAELFKIGTFDPVDERLHFPEIRVDLDTYQDYEALLRLEVGIEMESYEIIEAVQSVKDKDH
jgi:spore coat polysaccharide biosynthesis protein SpsF